MFSSYEEVYHNCSDDFILEKRLDLVRYANEFGIRACCKHFKTTKNTVRRWCRRYAIHGKKGLKNLSRAPKRVRRKISQQTIESIKEVVCDSEDKKKYITSVNVIRKLKLYQYNYFTINRYVQKFKKKRKKRENNSQSGTTDFKKDLIPFELVQIDIKYLTDIKQLKPYFKNRNLCKYQITFRDVCTGLSCVAYCYEKSLTNTYLFLKKVIYPFLSNIPGIDLKKIKVQTDNGAEFTNRDKRLYVKAIPEETIFTKFINENFYKHKTIIPGNCTAQSEVESFHWTIEKDCLAWDDIFDNKTLLENTSNFINEFNNRKRYKKDFTPVEKIKEFYNIDTLILPDVIILD